MKSINFHDLARTQNWAHIIDGASLDVRMEIHSSTSHNMTLLEVSTAVGAAI